jgi:hypothetical protein
MGALGDSVQRVKISKLGRKGLEQSAGMVEKMWQEIEHNVESMTIPPGQTRVYQDGLPVCGHEQQIVAELAGAGSRNYQLLLRLQSRGAILMGTESPELLVEEYQLATEGLQSATSGSNRRREQLGAILLDKRDRYIADRINRTLHSGETGILFLGMLHSVQAHLQPDIKIVYPLQTFWARDGKALDQR